MRIKPSTTEAIQIRTGGRVSGRFEIDEHTASVFERADKKMYDNKADLKAGGSE